MTRQEWEVNRKKILNESPSGLPSFQQLEDEYFGTLIFAEHTIVGGMPFTEGASMTFEDRFNALVRKYRLMWFFRNCEKRNAESNLSLWKMEMANSDALREELDQVNQKYSELAKAHYKLQKE